MSIDLDQFRDAFFEESFEALDTMEAALLEFDAGANDAERINTIFRVAHSIKGGSGMFGFTGITRFTHTLETLLDAVRSGRLAASAKLSELLLRSVDTLRAMMRGVQHGDESEPDGANELAAELEAMVPGSAAAAAHGSAAAPAPVAAPVPDRWIVRFRALPQLLEHGNDPLRMFGELEGLGQIETEADISALPTLDALDVTQCCVAWTLVVTTVAPRDAIELIFEWAQGDCELAIEPAPAAAPAAVSVAAPASAPASAPSAEAARASLTVPAATANASVPASAPPASAPPASTPPTSAPPARAAESSDAARIAGADSGSIRVSIEKIDELMNTVGEMVITQSMLAQLGSRLYGPDADRLRAGLGQLERNVRELQESVMRVRMLPIRFVFSRFPRVVRDLAKRLGKQIELQLGGEATELDKTVLEKIGDPLVHLVRNSIDHGIESPEARLAAGKPPIGTLRLGASHEGGAIRIEVRDDGKGLDRARIRAKAESRGLVSPGDVLTDAQVYELIFLPGFSTAEQATELSGRGVGMDVVRRNIAELGGTIELASEPGRGTRTIITLPLTLAIVDGLSVAVGRETYIVPLVAIVESMKLPAGTATPLIGRGEVFAFRGSYLPIIRLHEVFGATPRTTRLEEGLLMVVEGEGRRVGLFVDGLLGQQQVVIKSLEANYGSIAGVSGATILGDGAVALILDVPGLIRAAAHGPGACIAA